MRTRRGSSPLSPSRPCGRGRRPEERRAFEKRLPGGNPESPPIWQGPCAPAERKALLPLRLFSKRQALRSRRKKGGRGWFRGAKGEAQRISTPSATRTGRRENAPQDGQRLRDRIGSPPPLWGGPGPVSGGLLAAKEQGSALFPPAKQAAHSCLGRLARHFFPPAATRGGSGGGSREKPRFQAKKSLFLPLFFHKVLLAFPPCIKYNNAMLVGKSGEKW